MTAVVGVVPLRATADTLDSERAQAAAITAKIAALDATLAQLGEQIDQAQASLTAAEAAETAAEAALKDAAAKVDLARQRLKAQAVAAYVTGGSLPNVAVLMQSTENEAALRAGYLGDVAGSEQAAIEGLRHAEDQYSARRADMAAQRDRAAAVLDALTREKQASQQAADQEASQLSQIQGRVAVLVAQDQAVQAAQLRQAAVAGPAAAAPPAAGAAGVAVQVAESEVGKPYQYGAEGPDSFDCSGLTAYAWGQAGVPLPHSAADQWNDTVRVSYQQLQPGDLVFYYQPVDHVGIYIGNDEMVVADHTGTPVRYASIWRDGLDGFGRVTG